MKQKLNIVLAGSAVGCIITGYVLIAQESRVGPFLSVVGFALMIPAIMIVKNESFLAFIRSFHRFYLLLHRLNGKWKVKE